jgi:hypothetical protein
MNQLTESGQCQRCGEAIASFTPHLRTIAALQKAPREEHLPLLVAMEGAVPAEAEQWLRHEYYAACPKKVAHCPFCNAELRTWRAKQCLGCHRQLQPPGS